MQIGVKVQYPCPTALCIVERVVLNVYVADVWGSEKCDILHVLDRFQLRFFKYVLSLNKFTSSMMFYGKLGVISLY